MGGTIGAQASDPATFLVTGLSSIPEITIPSSGASRYTEAGSYTSLSFPNAIFDYGYIYFGPNFQVGAVPEPSGLAMLGAGGFALLVCGGRRRSRTGRGCRPSRCDAGSSAP